MPHMVSSSPPEGTKDWINPSAKDALKNAKNVTCWRRHRNRSKRFPSQRTSWSIRVWSELEVSLLPDLGKFSAANTAQWRCQYGLLRVVTWRTCAKVVPNSLAPQGIWILSANMAGKSASNSLLTFPAGHVDYWRVTTQILEWTISCQLYPIAPPSYESPLSHH